MFNLDAISQNTSANSDAELVSTFIPPGLKNLLRAVVIQTFDEDLKAVIGDLLRNVVQEEIERKLPLDQRNLENERHTPNPRILKLKFLQEVSSPVFTGLEIKGEGGCTLKVALIDDTTGNIVDSGTDASLEVEIVVLKGDVGAGGNDNWTAEEFINSIVRERETSNSLRRKASSPLLAESVFVKLIKGVGDVHNLRFKHTSNHMKNIVYRLGACVVDPNHGTRIQEAKTEYFLVKDQHFLRNMKHDKPSLSDDVWRLVNIGRRGPIYRRLREQHVNTVEDFLILLLRDPKLLKSMLSLKPSDLEKTVDNAKRCISDKIYCHTDSCQNTGVVFNISGEVLGLILQSQYVPADNLSQDAKANAPKLLASACEHWGEVECFDDQTSLLQKFSKPSSSTKSSDSPVPEWLIGFNDINDEMIEELHQGNIEALINDYGAGSSASVFGSTCHGNIDELMFPNFFETQANKQSEATDCFSNEPRDGILCKENVWKNWKILVNIVKWFSTTRQRRGAAVLGVHVQKKPRCS